MTVQLKNGARHVLIDCSEFVLSVISLKGFCAVINDALQKQVFFATANSTWKKSNLLKNSADSIVFHRVNAEVPVFRGKTLIPALK
jgi:hypothetical protein